MASGANTARHLALNVEDLRFNGDKVTVTVRKSKTDVEGKGLVKTVPAMGGELCPVAALKAWMDAADIASGPVFRRVDKWGHVHGRLSAQSVALVVKATAEAAGLDWRSVSGHSLRHSFVTAAMDGGASDSDVMQQTGHKSDRSLRGYRAQTGIGARRAVLAAFGVDGW